MELMVQMAAKLLFCKSLESYSPYGMVKPRLLVYHGFTALVASHKSIGNAQFQLDCLQFHSHSANFWNLSRIFGSEFHHSDPWVKLRKM